MLIYLDNWHRKQGDVTNAPIAKRIDVVVQTCDQRFDYLLGFDGVLYCRSLVYAPSSPYGWEVYQSETFVKQ